MDNSIRLQYLEAMGIDVWLPKQSVSISSSPVISAPKNLTDNELKNTEAVEITPQPKIETVEKTPETHHDEPVTQVSVSINQPISKNIEPMPTEAFSFDENPPIESYFDDYAQLPYVDETFQQIPTEQAQPIINVDTWENLETDVSNCQQCMLCQTRTQTVFGTGNKQADWMLIGEAPGESEDAQGKPFVGVAGQLLTEMIRALGLKRDDVFIANILKCRPPNNRDPKLEEITACNQYLQRQIALVQPKIILAVGRIAAQNLLNTPDSLAKLRGKVHYLGNIPLIVIYHPAYLLRFLNQKRKAWQDLQFALHTYNNNNNENTKLH